MGLLDIFKKKKEEAPDFNRDFGADQNTSEDFSQDDFSNSDNFNNNQSPFLKNDNLSPTFPNPTQFPQQFQSQDMNGKDIQLVLAKLDYLSQKLELMDRRIQLIEQIAKESR